MSHSRRRDNFSENLSRLSGLGLGRVEKFSPSERLLIICASSESDLNEGSFAGVFIILRLGSAKSDLMRRNIDFMTLFASLRGYFASLSEDRKSFLINCDNKYFARLSLYSLVSHTGWNLEQYSS